LRVRFHCDMLTHGGGDAHTSREARQMIDSGELSVTGMAKLLDVHRVTLHKGLKKHRAREENAA
jgi:transcriptional regulator of acetoin/glycerol metabolism